MNVNPGYRWLVQGRSALSREGAAIAALESQLGASFIQAVECLLRCKSHVLVSGAGTSAGVSRRLAHLLTCVGLPALFLDTGDSVHGAAGAVTANDVLIAISKSGETDELNHLVRVAHERGVPVITITGMRQSTLARQSDIVLDVSMGYEVDGYGVIPIGSSLASAAMGDALCFVILSERGYDATAFRSVHPGGAVGKGLDTTQRPGETKTPEFVSLRRAVFPLDIEQNDAEWQRAGGISSEGITQTRHRPPKEAISEKPEFVSLRRAELSAEAEDVGEWQDMGSAQTAN